MKKTNKNGLGAFAFVLGIFSLDQAVKGMVVSGMQPGTSIPVILNVFHLSYVQNTGAAFSFMKGHTELISLFTGLLLLALLAYTAIIIRRDRQEGCLITAMLLIFAGGAGNLFDRVLRGYVVDMFDFRVWPVFNVADIAICVGCALLVLYLLVLEPRSAKQKQ